MTLQELRQKNVAVYGLAVEGIPMANFLRDKVAKLTVIDQRDKEEILAKADPESRDQIRALIEDSQIDWVTGNGHNENLGRFNVLFRTPGISYYRPEIQEAIRLGTVISSQIKLFFDLCPAMIIGVTGTKGKGTTSSLISKILEKELKTQDSKLRSKVFLAGNIGVPAISLLDKIRQEDIVVLELSSFQLMDLHKSPHIAVVTNLAPEHQDYHKSIKEYQQAKFNIIAHQESGDYAILNQNSTFPGSWLSEVNGDITYFSSSETGEAEAFIRPIGNDLEVVLKSDIYEIVVCRQSEIKLIGRHNLENIAAASLAVWAAFPGEREKLIQIFQAVRDFEGLPFRLELVGEINGVAYINDSFGTTPGPTLAAISSIPKDKVLILGGSSKGADFTELAEKIAASNVIGVVLIGDEAKKIEEALKKAGYQGELINGGTTMAEIIMNASKIAQPGSAVILSPACASFGLFANYKDRGKQFNEVVKKLKSNGTTNL